ncbi:MAG: aminotransferase class I/II-fold pyridoxal phosphate-dependent enzyme [Acidobacteriota bacterium]|nr:aminotransferase class I/II-fold pyridoxal phosphate-dependent enzyme [Acidobacteriota bacterium]
MTLSRPGKPITPYATLDDEAIVRNSITYKSVSKSFNLSMMKCAYLFSTNPDYLDRIRGVGQHRQSMKTLGIIAAEAAYNECKDWLEQLLAYIDGTLDFVQSFVSSHIPRVSAVKPEGTYLAWLDVASALERAGISASTLDPSDPNLTPERAFQQHLVEQAHVHLNPGSDYGLGGAGHMRMSTATSRQLVDRALRNLATALA